MPIILRESACTTTWTSPSHSHDEADEIWLVYQSFEIVDEPAGFCDGRRQRRNQAANDVF